MTKQKYLEYAWPLFQALQENQQEQQQLSKMRDKLRSSFRKETDIKKSTQLLRAWEWVIDYLLELRQRQIALSSFLSPVC